MSDLWTLYSLKPPLDLSFASGIIIILFYHVLFIYFNVNHCHITWIRKYIVSEYISSDLWTLIILRTSVWFFFYFRLSLYEGRKVYEDLKCDDLVSSVSILEVRIRQLIAAKNWRFGDSDICYQLDFVRAPRLNWDR